MTPLPAALGGKELVAWRLDRETHRDAWDSGEGSYRAGGRWNGKGVRAVYCSIDPATAILEVAVHKGFKALDVVAHVLTAMAIAEPMSVHVVDPASVPDPNWLRPGVPSAGQQFFGDALLAAHKFVLVPSVVSTHSWNLVFVGTAAAGAYVMRSQERFAARPASAFAGNALGLAELLVAETQYQPKSASFSAAILIVANVENVSDTAYGRMMCSPKRSAPQL